MTNDLFLKRFCSAAICEKYHGKKMKIAEVFGYKALRYQKTLDSFPERTPEIKNGTSICLLEENQKLE